MKPNEYERINNMEGVKSDHIAEAGEISGKVWYDIKQVMKKLNCSQTHAHRLIRAGQLKPIRFGRLVRFVPEEIEELMTREEANR